MPGIFRHKQQPVGVSGFRLPVQLAYMFFCARPDLQPDQGQRRVPQRSANKPAGCPE
jgi:hypothetical protein